MRLTIFAAAITLLLWGAPVFAQDFDGDGVVDGLDNCSEAPNPTQDDTDGDFCGNLCDTDYNNDGVIGLPPNDDLTEFLAAFGTTDEEKVHRDPVSGKTVGYKDWGVFLRRFLLPPGPSGTTPGTAACP